MIRRNLLSILGLCLSATAVYAQSPRDLSLEEAKDLVIRQSPVVKNARLDLAIQEAKNAEITGLALPQIGAEGRYTDYLDPMQTFVPGEFFGGPPGSFAPVTFTPKFNTTAAVNASQILFDGSVLVALQARQAVITLAENQVKLTEEEMRYQVQRAYHSLVITHKQFDLMKDALETARTIYRDAQAIYEVGLSEKIELERSEVQINNIVSDSMKVGALIEVNERLFKHTLGLDPETPIRLVDTAVQSGIEEVRSQLLAETRPENRTDYQLSLSALRLNEYDLKRHRLSAMPTLAAFINGNYSYAASQFEDLFGVPYIFTSFYGLQISFPLFDGWQRRSRVKQAKLSIEKSQNNLAHLREGINVEVKNARARLKNSLLDLETQKRNMELSESVLDLAHRKYKEGVGSNMEVSMAQTELLGVQNAYFQAMLAVYSAGADLQKALGNFK